MSAAPIPARSIILRSNAGLIRDAFTEFKDGDNWLVIRQLKFDSHGSSPEIKILRLETDEVEAVIKLWGGGPKKP